MKVLNLKIKNIKCFKEIEIPFEDNGQIKNWSLIVGNNGQGKTTILRCLALGLCDESGASALLAELYGDILRENKEEEEGLIEIILKDEDENKKYQIKTKISLKGNSESVSQIVCPLNSESEATKEISVEELSNIRNKIFTIAYGAGRTISGTQSYEEYAVVDSVYGLFNYTYPLQNPELGAWRIKSAGKLDKLENCLKEILMLDNNDEIKLNASGGLYIKSKWWKNRPLSSLSDGYHSLTTVIIDFLSWKLLHNSKEFNLTDISGIFIIDEVEQHLHPKWQRNIIRVLSERFPKIQFIGSTHTPICALGLNDLTCKSQLIKASYTNSHSEVEIFDMKEVYKGYRIDQILTSDIFELTSARSKSIEKKLEEYRKIYLKDSKERNKEDKEKLADIEKELKNLPVWETEQDKSTREKLIRLIEKNKGSNID